MTGTTREEANVGTPLLDGVDGLARGLQNDQLERHLQPLSQRPREIAETLVTPPATSLRLARIGLTTLIFALGVLVARSRAARQ